MMERIIVDTDFETDCDDAGALAILHGLADRGRVEIAGICASIHSPWPAAGVRALNLAFGRPDVPVAVNSGIPNSERYLAVRATHIDRCYHESMTAMYPESAPGRFLPEESSAFYRRILENSPDGSVTICAIGLLTALADFLRKDGAKELIARKVKRLVSMAEAAYPAGADGFNWNMDREAAAFILQNWPGELVVTPLGGDVFTAVYPCGDHPRAEILKLAYRKMGGGCEEYRRPSWDLIAVLYCAGLVRHETMLSPVCRIDYDPQTGRHQCTDDPNGKHRILQQTVDCNAMAKTVQCYLNTACCPVAEGCVK